MEQSTRKVSSKKIIAKFNLWVECITTFDACKEAMWLYRFTGKLGVAPSIEKYIPKSIVSLLMVVLFDVIIYKLIKKIFI